MVHRKSFYGNPTRERGRIQLPLLPRLRVLKLQCFGICQQDWYCQKSEFLP